MAELLFEVTYPHPLERVWRALTDSKALAAWLMPNDFTAVVGHRFTFRAPPQPWFDGVVRCEVLAVEPPRQLSYSWQGGPMRSPTTVTWMLEPVPAGTRVRRRATVLQCAGPHGQGQAAAAHAAWAGRPVR